MNASRTRLVVLAMVLGSAVTAALVFGLHLGGGRQANATQGATYAGHFSIGSCTANCVVTAGTNFAVDINLDTWPNPYDGLSIDVSTTTGACVSASTAAIATSWPNRVDVSGCFSPAKGEAAAVMGVADSSATQKGKVAEVVFSCVQSGTISLEQSSFIVTTVAHHEEPVSIGDLQVTCNPTGPTFTPTPTRTPTNTPTPTSTPIQYTGHLSIGSCTANCSVPVPGSNFTVDINLDTSPAAYEAISIALISTTGGCISANTAAMATSWPRRIEESACFHPNEGEAAGGKGLDSPTSQKGKIGEVTFKCSQSGTISLDPGSFIEVGSTGVSERVTIGDLQVICASSGPTATPTVTRAPTPTVVFSTAFAGHLSIGSCTATCSVAGNTSFVVSLNLDTIAAPYDAVSLDVISTTDNCKSANPNAARVFWPNLIDLASCLTFLTPREGEVAASKGITDSPSIRVGKVGEIVFTCSQEETLSLDRISFVINAITGFSVPVTMPDLHVTCKATFTATPTLTRTPTPPPPVGGVSIDPALPRSEAAGPRIDEVIGVAAAGAVAMGGAVWYGRKRRARRG